ncbi:MAG TPA: hypothetical protein IAC50_07880 [Candidatus Copromorpha excrementigallinarum]|uniref:DNA polymerase III subunit delta n=1 Tax=Candidatus Allocopromorpha excrementigallinarum TaxID=2840742 RepID=A0A9D1L7Q5_9FIRM|nr:hypothetical protein [Candidatus Copromorpha excrementigallinarum]
MLFINNKENRRLTERLERAVRDEAVSHAYIFEGPVNAEKRKFADSFIKGMLCPKKLGENCGECPICDKIDHGNHEDIMYVSKSGETVKDAQITEAQERLRTKPVGDRNVVVVEDADTMTLRAQNRLLKTLEEPPGEAVIILLSENMENLTQTVQSRCVKYRINYFGSEGYDFMMDKARKTADMALRGAPFYALKDETGDVTKNRRDAEAFLESLQNVYREMLLRGEQGIAVYKNEDIAENVYAVEAARRQMKQGVAAAYAVKGLLLKIGG